MHPVWALDPPLVTLHVVPYRPYPKKRKVKKRKERAGSVSSCLSWSMAVRCPMEIRGFCDVQYLAFFLPLWHPWDHPVISSPFPLCFFGSRLGGSSLLSFMQSFMLCFVRRRIYIPVSGAWSRKYLGRVVYVLRISHFAHALYSCQNSSCSSRAIK